MSRKTTFAVKTFIAASMLTAALSGAAHADDSSMSRFGGDSYAYFNQPTSSASSAWHQAQGVSERALEAESSEQLATKLQGSAPLPTAASDPGFRATHPSGFTERELQALSSEASPWQLRGDGSHEALSTTETPQQAQGTTHQTLGARLAALFHRSTESDDSVTR